MQQPFIPLLISLIAGIAAGNLFFLPDGIVILGLGATSGVLLVSAIKKWLPGIALAVVLFLFFFGILTINLYRVRTPDRGDVAFYTDSEIIAVEGIISENPRVSITKTDLIIATTAIVTREARTPVTGKILLSVKGITRTFKYGDVVRVKTRLKIPHNFNNPGRFDYERYLRFRGIRARGFIDSAEKIILIREHSGNRLITGIESVRSSLRTCIRNSVPSVEGTILQALLLGERGEIPEILRENFTRAGITHVLAISGLHIGIISSFAFLVFNTILKQSEYLLLRFDLSKMSALLSIIPVISYAFIAGFGISTVRATIMILLFLLALFMGRERDLLNTLACAAFIILVCSPVSLFDVSFQLSFTAVASILIVTPAVSGCLPQRKDDESAGLFPLGKKLIQGVVLFVIVSAAATIGTFPLIALYFNRFSSVVLIANLLIIPIIGFAVLPTGMTAMLLAWIAPGLASLLLKISAGFLSLALSLTNMLASLPFATFFVTTPSGAELALYYLIVGSGIALLNRHVARARHATAPGPTRKDAILAITLAVLLVSGCIERLYLHYTVHHPGTLEATFIDVGQGSSTLVRFPEGSTALIDGGGFYSDTFDVGKYIVAPFLWHERIKDIDIVILTHPHHDHLQGLLFILEHFNVKEVWTNGESTNTESFKIFMEIVRNRRIPVRYISAKVSPRMIDGVTVSILNPPEVVTNSRTVVPGYNDMHTNVLVLKMTLGTVSMLLPSDLSPVGEKRILARHDDISSRILLVPHHGSYSSSTTDFIKAVHPEIAVISCGREGYFRNLHPDVITRYQKMHARIFRTDINGAIRISTNGHSISTSCFK